MTVLSDKESDPSRTRRKSKSHILEESLRFGAEEHKYSSHISDPTGISNVKLNTYSDSGKVKATAILLCGGSGNRFNYDFSEYPQGKYYIPEGVPKSKQFIHIYNVPLFVYSLSELIHNPSVSEIIISSKPPWFSKIVEMIVKSREFIANYGEKMDVPGYSVDLIDNYPFGKIHTFAYDFSSKNFILDLKDIENDEEARYKFIKFVESGPERCNSAYNALRHLEDHTKDDHLVLIHDGARPLIKLIDLDLLIKNTVKYGACIPAYRPADTIKLVDDKIVSKTLDRSKTYVVQTPQAFKYKLIKDAYDNVMDSLIYEPMLHKYFTDDSSILESQFVNVVVANGHQFNLKLSYNNDLDLCRFLIKKSIFNDAV
ncbi:2-C-methyl-D-erythritol 4-phosphate cytidylyltransferase [Theileria orientalis strain Shintoku]|uniref:2-C-methyl-D-erythritol 4-phosphate cytidylyltransferase n=1 Tax=Theileria orientalis strain Shintoku TaxID=869250 RepID=J4D9R2_THEOR|nr:2-C-methyl-D-erythritol 4-phosphate cytidylyltransferase [Theileria orientalis strain Shintoku]BAM41545.1 2-C-methyl-D-erythritol 4-phosphate cytidylyltransferase [Theileria orientalis strain Shintoku]|eukprot:XP_009691846.1 2-C-methyl-D-erythritol 4-phosphate cytidylyltransferase [Theileria orientalis strain Shintoku]